MSQKHYHGGAVPMNGPAATESRAPKRRIDASRAASAVGKAVGGGVAKAAKAAGVGHRFVGHLFLELPGALAGGVKGAFQRARR